MEQVKRLHIQKSGERELVITRTFAAPRQLGAGTSRSTIVCRAAGRHGINPWPWIP